jgi:hypothetical protein
MAKKCAACEKAKMQKGGALKTTVDSSTYFRNKFDNAYENLKSGKISKKVGMSEMNKATEGSRRQLEKKGITTKKTGGTVNSKKK